MEQQLALEVETPIRWTVRCIRCGAALDSFTTDELASVANGMPEKEWQEASMWAVLAQRAHDRQGRPA